MWKILWAQLAAADVGNQPKHDKIHLVSYQLMAKPIRSSVALASVVIASIITLALAVSLAPPASAQTVLAPVSTQVKYLVDSTNTTAVDSGQGGDIGILPRPNSGSAPKSSNERGGWEQYAVMTAIVVALIVIVLLIRRESKRSKIVFEERHQND